MANELKVQNGLVVKGATRITGSLSTTGGITGSLLGTASLATTATNALTLNGASAGAYATTASNTFTGIQTFNNNVIINGTASIAYLNVTYESASIIYSTGSNQLGDASNDTQTIIGTAIFSGSMQSTGSLSFANGFGVTGSLFGTASWASNALSANTASYVLQAVSASFATTAANSTQLNGQAASYYLNASNINTGTLNNSYLPSQINVTGVTASFTGSLTGTASYASQALTASYAMDAKQLGGQTPSYYLNATNINAGTIGNAYLPAQINVTGVSASFTGSLTGALVGTASWATTAVNSTQLNGQAASYYTNATNINAGTIGNAYLPSAINVTSVTASFKGNLVGTASWATNATSAGSATTATNATNTTNVAVTDNPSGAGPYYITFVSATTGNQAITVDSSTLTYDPSTNVTTTTASYASQSLSASFASNAKQLNGQSDTYYLNASNINAGTLGNAYLPSAINVTSVTASFRGNLTGTASYASQALTASFATTAATASTVTGTIASASVATTASFAATASYVNTLNQDVTIGSGYYLSVGANSKTFSGKQLNKATATTIISVNTATYAHKSMFVRYVLTTASGTTDMRAGTIILVSDANGNVSIAEATTQDIGDTSMVNFTATASGGINEIVMTPSLGNWDVFFDYTLI